MSEDRGRRVKDRRVDLLMERGEYDRIVKAVIGEQAKTGQPLSVSEWIREACRRRLEGDD